MKKLPVLRLFVLSILLVWQPALYAGNERSIPVSISLYGDTATSFSVYTSSTGSVPLNAVPLSSGGYEITDDVRYVAGKAYIDLTPGNTGSWYLVIYTTNPSTAEFNPDDYSDLINTGDPSQKIQWKYRNPHIFGNVSTPVGSLIPDCTWRDPNMLEYKYFLNLSNGKTAHDINEEQTLAWASVAHYKNTRNKPCERIELLFGVDLSTTDEPGTYRNSLSLEIYYAP